MYTFEIEFIDSYGHIIHYFRMENKTEKQAIRKAKQVKKDMYPECAWIEIINTETLKRIYA